MTEGGHYCKVYFTSAAAVSRHRKGCPSLHGILITRPEVVDLVEEDMAMAADAVVDDEAMPIISIEDILNSPFIEIDR